jgi:protoporphyrinogen/coproporphyrinogen III oxidase
VSEPAATGPVFVIGARPSGLSAAHRLNKRGHQVVVLERRERELMRHRLTQECS